MNESLFEAVARSSRELMKHGFSAEEFAALVQKNNMTDTEILAVDEVFDYLTAKKASATVEFLLRTSRLPLKVPKTFRTSVASSASPSAMQQTV